MSLVRPKQFQNVSGPSQVAQLVEFEVQLRPNHIDDHQGHQIQLYAQAQAALQCLIVTKVNEVESNCQQESFAEIQFGRELMDIFQEIIYMDQFAAFNWLDVLMEIWERMLILVRVIQNF